MMALTTMAAPRGTSTVLLFVLLERHTHALVFVLLLLPLQDRRPLSSTARVPNVSMAALGEAALQAQEAEGAGTPERVRSSLWLSALAGSHLTYLRTKHARLFVCNHSELIRVRCCRLRR